MVCPLSTSPVTTADVPPAAKWMRVEGGLRMGVGGTGVSGTAVGGTAVGGTAVGGTEVAVTTTGVGGTDVLVGSAAMTAVVEVGTTGSGLVSPGGVLAAGSLHPVAANTSITNKMPMKIVFLFIVFSLSPSVNIPTLIFYIILQNARGCFG
jgi:hypothetical protein